LEAAGHDVLTVVAALPAAPGDDVMALAIADGRVIVTEDKDFGELAFRDGYRPPGMIRLVWRFGSPLHSFRLGNQADFQI